MKSFIYFALISVYCLPIFAQKYDSISIALDIIDLTFDESEIDSLKGKLYSQRENIKVIRRQSFPNDLPYCMVFIPPIEISKIPDNQLPIEWGIEKDVQLPKEISELAFYPVHELATLIKSGQITSLELTELFLDRIRKYGDTLECVITITDSLAIEQAKRADAELRQGIYRGPLHGIPYGVKDLLALKGYKTTWGANPYKDQMINYTATVIQKLEEAGAVLVVKLTLGALAWGDVWYGGQTKNPWNLLEGSSGSSAGSASATVAGLVPFAIGSETLGSIVHPSHKCGATGLRPTYGRVSKHGAMVASWSMDKLGPICRNAFDCALVFNAILGTDGIDFSVREFPFNYNYKHDVKKLKIGVLTDLLKLESLNYSNDSTTIELLESHGFQMIQKQLPYDYPVESLAIILNAESGAAFDELTRSNRDTLLVRQIRELPNENRASRLIPAVEYIQANRLRHGLTLQFNELMKDIDVLIAPSLGSQNLITNLTGHPCVIVPNGQYDENNPSSITLIGNHFNEANILLFARYLQQQTLFDEQKPSQFLK